jgi:hypothetical protein
MSRCCWNSGELQCRFPGTFSPGLNGGGPWKCVWHKELGSDAIDQKAGAEIVTRSHLWSGREDDYLAMRETDHTNAPGVVHTAHAIAKRHGNKPWRTPGEKSAYEEAA